MKALNKLAEFLLGLGALACLSILGPEVISQGDWVDFLDTGDKRIVPYVFLGGMAMILLSVLIIAFLALIGKLDKGLFQANDRPDQVSG